MPTPPTSATYTKATSQTDNSIRIRINDDDDVPTGLSIKSVYNSVTEGQSPVFQVTNNVVTSVN